MKIPTRPFPGETSNALPLRVQSVVLGGPRLFADKRQVGKTTLSTPLHLPRTSQSPC